MAVASTEIDHKVQGESKNKKEMLLLYTDQKTFPKITLSQKDNKGLFVNIETQNLLIRSVQMDDLNDCISLYGDEIVMHKFGPGQIMNKKLVTDRMRIWLERWNDGGCFSPLSVFKKNSHKFAGQIILTAGEKDGEVELAALFHKSFWGQKIASEAAAAIVSQYIPLLIQQGYKAGNKPIEAIFATAKKDNHASNAALRTLGLSYIGDIKKFNAIRSYYRKDYDVNNLCLRAKL